MMIKIDSYYNSFSGKARSLFFINDPYSAPGMNLPLLHYRRNFPLDFSICAIILLISVSVDLSLVWQKLIRKDARLTFSANTSTETDSVSISCDICVSFEPAECP